VILILLAIAGQFLMSLFFGKKYILYFIGEVSYLIVQFNKDSSTFSNNLESLEEKIRSNNFP
jgi:hypothetical protein